MHDIIGQERINKGVYWSKSLTLMSGCNPISDGCKNCWSARQASRFDWGKEYVKNGKWNGRIKPNWEVLKWLQQRAKSQRKLKPQVFCIWNDLFFNYYGENTDTTIDKLYNEYKSHNSLSFIDDVFRAMYYCNDIFLILTKRPENIFKPGWYSFDRAAETNRIWIGVTVESQKYIHRIDTLYERWKGKKFVSIELYLEPINLHENIKKIDFVIIGSESGPNHRIPPDYPRLWEMICLCKENRVPIFLKQWDIDGKLIKMPEIFGHKWDQFPEINL
jgi:protein gp37